MRRQSPREILAASLGRLTEQSRRVVGEPRTEVRTEDLRTVLAAFHATHATLKDLQRRTAEQHEPEAIPA